VRAVLVGAGAVAALVALRAASPTGPARTNYRGRSVSLRGGPALAAAASLTAAAGAPGACSAAAVLIAGLGSGVVGRYDDTRAQPAKGFRGHLAALRRGQVTTGVVKILGVGAAATAAAVLLAADPATGGPGRPAAGRPTVRGALSTLLGAGVIAGAANLVNLLDLRPGRALKVGLLAGTPLLAGPAGGLAAGPVGASAALLPADLDEQIMLGDCGANALGAVLGVALAARTGPAGRAGALAVIAALTAASERVSFTRVIARTPALRALDEFGRRDTRGSAGTGPHERPGAVPAERLPGAVPAERLPGAVPAERLPGA
jgi:UDP-N-acetylmuramyl pentapeptide phosphotransferase/UDP-N-acetylglucosamine-1-phosphate transferase